MVRRRYFPAPKNGRHTGIIVTVLILLFVFTGAFAIYRFIHPFQSLNPMYHEVTVGQKVIDDWTYNGKNLQGYLVFSNLDTTHILPPNAHELALDGKYVVIEDASNNSLTYAEPIESLPYLWIFVGLGVVGGTLFLLVRSRGRNVRAYSMRKMKFRTYSHSRNAQLLRSRGQLWLQRRLARWRRF